MFSFFKKSENTTFPSLIWKTGKESLKGTSMEALRTVTDGGQALLISFFSSTQDAFKAFFTENNIPFLILDGQNFPDLTSEKIVLLAESDTIMKFPEVSKDLQQLSEKKKLTILFTSHYPLAARELEVSTKLPQGKGVSIFFSVALEDEFFTVFGGERIRDMMEKMGMKDDESIQHSMVDKAIARAQEKIAEKVSAEIKSTTEKDWFRNNMK